MSRISPILAAVSSRCVFLEKPVVVLVDQVILHRTWDRSLTVPAVVEPTAVE